MVAAQHDDLFLRPITHAAVNRECRDRTLRRGIYMCLSLRTLKVPQLPQLLLLDFVGIDLQTLDLQPSQQLIQYVAADDLLVLGFEILECLGTLYHNIGFVATHGVQFDEFLVMLFEGFLGLHNIPVNSCDLLI